jgi:hypothetical protein
MQDINDAWQADGPCLDVPPNFAATNPQTFPANKTVEGFGRRCFRNRHKQRINNVPKKGQTVYNL